MDIYKQIYILSKRITPSRYSKFLHALNNRTRKLTVVLEDIFQPHNGAAVLRSCDAFGVQDVHIIESRYTLKISPHVDMGTSKWMSLHHYTIPEARPEKNNVPKLFALTPAGKKNVDDALDSIKSKGYMLAASTLRRDACAIDDLPTDRPIALMIGTELSGLSDEARAKADVEFTIPMLGFAQSFNLSVFSAICLKELSTRMRHNSVDWPLSKDEKNELLLEWLRLSVANADEVLKLEGDE